MSQDRMNQDKSPSKDRKETPVISSQSFIIKSSSTSSKHSSTSSLEPVSRPSLVVPSQSETQEGPEGHPSRRSVFRVENIDLRCLVGYIDGPLDPDRPSDAEKHEVTGKLKELPKISGSLMKACLIVGVDVDNGKGNKTWPNLASHVGVSLLDTQHIWKLVSEPRVLSEEDQCIVSHQFQLRDDGSSLNKKRRYCFGKTEGLELGGFKKKFEKLIGGKNFVLVYHGGCSLDLKFLKHVGIDTSELIILDTVKAAEWIMQTTGRRSLEDLNKELGIDDCNGRLMHIAGNDANFCIRVLLMLAVKDIEWLRRKPESPSSKVTLNAVAYEIYKAMKTIAHAPRPASQLEKDEEKIAARKREKQEALEREQRAAAQRSTEDVSWEDLVAW